MRFGLFLWDFVVGDDWVAAACVAVAIGVAALIVWAGINAWWLIPIGIALTLWLSLRRATRAS